MKKQFTLEYWIDDGHYVGKIKEVPAVFGEGKSLEELKRNIRKAYKLLVKSDGLPESKVLTSDVEIEVKSDINPVEILKNMKN